MRARSMKVKEKVLVVLCGDHVIWPALDAFGVFWRPNLYAEARCAHLSPVTRMLARGGVSVAVLANRTGLSLGTRPDPRPAPNPLVNSNASDFGSPPRRENIIC
ncbi:hypothetical protein B0H12DRAFT_1148183 [Mycena haematopus]|nr:hypothetical protein B0H12DRAFT_1155142 [Mycena haematopus]KAJ7218980.1 hypothetical protein B0H12DRAFT_1152944 [Mycena haematopus]KAJ7226369.1 hypothetical protein B0H12DRAFT_1149192 [Mycena haematopus]KAJ7228031.1 hypothetical protein B0H12DRAFT_1148183 [Mycena haematopus]